jgi:hypothetical protein
MLLTQLLAVVIIVGLVTLTILAFIEPGPLDRRSRTRRGQRPPQPGQEPEVPAAGEEAGRQPE